jgi:hypothetical protein
MPQSVHFLHLIGSSNIKAISTPVKIISQEIKKPEVWPPAAVLFLLPL